MISPVSLPRKPPLLLQVELGKNLCLIETILTYLSDDKVFLIPLF